MSDVFSLAPEGQSWTDDKTSANPARPEDYDPTFFQGSISAIPSGIAEGAVGLGQSAVGFSKRLISDPAFSYTLAPTINAFRVMFPDADKTLNETYDTVGKQLKNAREYVKPDAGSQGTAASVLHGLGQFVPAIGATAVGGPVVGGSVAFGTSYEQAAQDFTAKGVDQTTARELAVGQSALNAVGMGLPAAVGKQLATRIASGVLINTAFGGVNRFAVGETLEEKGYSDLAKQYRVWDGQAILIDAVLGGAFGGAHHLAARGSETPTVRNVEPEAAIPAAEVGSTEQGIQPVEPSLTPVEQPQSASSDAQPAATYDSRVSELQGLAEQLIPVGDRKSLASDIYSAQRSLDGLEQQRQVLKDGKATTSSARRIRDRDMAALDVQIEPARANLEQQRQQLADNTRGGKYFEAKADLSRLEQGIIPESMAGLIPETPVKPSDIDAAHTLNEGLYYDIESAPVLHGTNESINSHVAAMDEAARQINDGQPVNITMQARGLDGVVRPGVFDAATEQYHAMESVFQENGISYTTPREAISEPQVMRSDSAFAAADDVGQVSIDPDTGSAISSNNFDLMSARDMALTNADMTITHPDTGQPVKLSEALAQFDEQIATTQKESKVYSVAAACFLRNP
ncbi:hypothetical protein FH968_04430 [Buttiauxella sp. B2]|uniref:hypothetical protein n=1 Tax=Buttiauxella sp. B2 TaxID=2587812 RepID=UPI00112052DE|nr:hypothetical protein [Buttiauxella sp. B2]TNV22127.1 hypothetical protein FH968_04430 [Buttiauxella sp. B2]